MMGEQAHPGTAIPFLAGFPDHVVGLSIERACTTAMMAVHIAHADPVRPGRRLRCRRPGQHDPLPHPDHQGWDGHGRGDQAGRPYARGHESEPEAVRPRQPDRAERRPGCGASRRAIGITREAMDRWALRSHERAIAARDRLREEIVPVEGLDRTASPSPSRTTRARAPTPATKGSPPCRRCTVRTAHHRRHVVRSGRRGRHVPPHVGGRSGGAASPPWRASTPSPPAHAPRRTSSTPPFLRPPGIRALRADATGHERDRGERGVRLRAPRLDARIGFEDAGRVNPNGGACALGSSRRRLGRAARRHHGARAPAARRALRAGDHLRRHGPGRRDDPGSGLSAMGATRPIAPASVRGRRRYPRLCRTLRACRGLHFPAGDTCPYCGDAAAANRRTDGHAPDRRSRPRRRATAARCRSASASSSSPEGLRRCVTRLTEAGPAGSGPASHAARRRAALRRRRRHAVVRTLRTEATE